MVAKASKTPITVFYLDNQPENPYNSYVPFSKLFITKGVLFYDELFYDELFYGDFYLKPNNGHQL
jgi:hypothetical protein